MKFYSNTVWKIDEGGYVTEKTYYCPNCHYKRRIREGNGEVEVLEGDKEFMLFPFSSLTKTDGTHAELAACPCCQTLQYVDKVEDERETDYILH